jgi:hypothetical protein
MKNTGESFNDVNNQNVYQVHGIASFANENNPWVLKQAAEPTSAQNQGANQQRDGGREPEKHAGVEPKRRVHS